MEMCLMLEIKVKDLLGPEARVKRYISIFLSSPPSRDGVQIIWPHQHGALSSLSLLLNLPELSYNLNLNYPGVMKQDFDHTLIHLKKTKCKTLKSHLCNSIKYDWCDILCWATPELFQPGLKDKCWQEARVWVKGCGNIRFDLDLRWMARNEFFFKDIEKLHFVF